MTRAVLGFVIAAFAVAMNPQAKRPDFSGLWVMVSPQAGNEVLIKQDVRTFTTGPPSGQPGSTVVYKLDGTESRNVMVNDGVESVAVGKASWNGNQLTIANTISWRPGEQLNQLLVWSFNDQNQLVLEVRNQGSEGRKLIYKRKE
jgi:hypothetical protein